MPEIAQLEIYTNETATITADAVPGLDLELTLESVATVGLIPDPEVVEVVVLGTVQVPGGPVVYNYGDAPGIAVRDVGETDFSDLPPGTIVFFK